MSVPVRWLMLYYFFVPNLFIILDSLKKTYLRCLVDFFKDIMLYLKALEVSTPPFCKIGCCNEIVGAK